MTALCPRWCRGLELGEVQGEVGLIAALESLAAGLEVKG